MFLLLLTTLPRDLHEMIFSSMTHKKRHMATTCCRALRSRQTKPASHKNQAEIIRCFIRSSHVHFDSPFLMRMPSVDQRALMRWIQRQRVFLDEGGFYVEVPFYIRNVRKDGHFRVRVELWDRATAYDRATGRDCDLQSYILPGWKDKTYNPPSVGRRVLCSVDGLWSVEW